jgi:hypothetical protein
MTDEAPDDDTEPDMKEYELDTSNWFHEEDGVGVKLDTLLATMMEAKDAEHRFNRFHVQLDALLEQPEVLKQEEVKELRKIQHRFQHYAQIMNVRKMQLEEELEEVKQEREDS